MRNRFSDLGPQHGPAEQKCWTLPESSPAVMTIFRMPSRTTLRTQDKCWPYWPAFLRSERTEADWERVLEFFYHYTHSDVVDGKPFYAWDWQRLQPGNRWAFIAFVLKFWRSDLMAAPFLDRLPVELKMVIADLVLPYSGSSDASKSEIFTTLFSPFAITTVPISTFLSVTNPAKGSSSAS